MTTPEYVHRIVLPAAYALLPAACRSDAASALLLSIGLQESRFEYRRQFNQGPATSFLQFERTGVAGVLIHPITRPILAPILDTLQYPATASACHVAIEHHDVLALIFGRLLLWTLPQALPARGDVEEAWSQYLEAWRPGRPWRESWDGFYQEAWQMVAETPP